MSHVACHMSHVKCLCWSLGHAEQLLFSCLCSNFAVYGWKVQWLFFDTTSSTLACEWTNHRAGSQLKISHFFSPLPRINLMQSNWLGQLSQAGGYNGGMCWPGEEIEGDHFGPALKDFPWSWHSFHSIMPTSQLWTMREDICTEI